MEYLINQLQIFEVYCPKTASYLYPLNPRFAFRHLSAQQKTRMVFLPIKKSLALQEDAAEAPK